MAQAGHAAQLAWWATSPRERAAWTDTGLAVSVRTASPYDWAKLVEADLPAVRDAGFTEIEPGSVTVIATAPGWPRAATARRAGAAAQPLDRQHIGPDALRREALG